MSKKLIIQNINKTFATDNGTVEAIKNISFNVENGEIIGIVGQSGCGKSTLLNIISGIESDYNGSVKYDKDNPKISYMLQNDALLSHLNILNNALIGLEIQKNKTTENVDFVKKMLSNYGLQEFLYKYPHELSGGMRQRVSLVRSLSIKPDIILLDEPFSALDYYTRITVSEDVLKILRKEKITAILITHDIQEACSLCDKIIVLSKRPSTVKNIYDVSFSKLDSILKKRDQNDFTNLYKKIWGDLYEEIS